MIRLIVCLLTFCSVLFLFSCTPETEYCRAYCQRAGECEQCGGEIDIKGCIRDCKDLSREQQEKLVDCYKGECENIYICDLILGVPRPTPCQ